MRVTIGEFFSRINDSFLNFELIEALEKYYGLSVSEEAAAVFSAFEEGARLDVERTATVLASETVLFAEEMLSADFAEERLLPLINLGDGDFLCYVGDTMGWGCYSITDHILYNTDESLLTVMTMAKLIRDAE